MREQSHRATNKSFVCKHCQMDLKQKRDFDSHLCPMLEKEFVCPKCKVDLKSDRNFNKHLCVVAMSSKAVFTPYRLRAMGSVLEEMAKANCSKLEQSTSVAIDPVPPLTSLQVHQLAFNG